MRLYLIRHGDAVDASENQSRPLSSKGREEAYTAGRILKKVKAKPKFFYHSDLLRAAETAQLIAKELSCVDILDERKGLRPEDRVDVWVHELSHASSDGIIVGHLPFLPSLASALLVGSSDILYCRQSTGSILCLEREGFGGWALRFLMPAKYVDLIEE